LLKHKRDNELKTEARETKGSQARLLAGLLAELLIGSLAGAVAMLLLAPQLGRRTR